MPLKIDASFYKVQYEHKKRSVVGCVYVFIFSISWRYVSAKNWQNCVTSD